MEPKVDEEFKVCPFNTSLKVSKSGIVKRTDNGEILEQIAEKKHYFVKDPRNDEKKECVHRLVARTWLPEGYKKGKGMVVHHKDGNGLNNHVDNLVWENCCVHAAAFHGVSMQCEECEEAECEYRYYFQTPSAGTIT
jgi:hypothetical protein